MTSTTPPEPGRRRVPLPHLRQRRASAWPRPLWPPPVRVVPCDLHPPGHRHDLADLLMSPARSADPLTAWVVTAVCPDGHVNVFWWSDGEARRGLIDGVRILHVPAKHAPGELRDRDRAEIALAGPIRKDEVDELTHAMASRHGDAEIARWIARF